MKVSYRGNVVTKDSVLTDSFVTVEDGIITYVGKERPENTEIEDYSGKYIMAGFIDIHCHASALNMATDNPKEVGEYHLSHGTTSMLLTYYRDVPHEKLLECLKKVKENISLNPKELMKFSLIKCSLVTPKKAIFKTISFSKKTAQQFY